MRPSPFLALAALCHAACLLAGCAEEDPAPLYVQTEYQVRCLGCQPQAVDDRARVVQALDGENGFTIECSTNDRGGDRLVTFSAIYTDPEQESRSHSISIAQAALDGDDPGSSCTVTVTEGANTYEGRCTGDDPTEERPCRVELSAEGGVVSGTVLCEGIANRSAAMVTRHVVAPGTEEAVEFEVHGCLGL